uniref:Uncharacterized protein n=1 Tax=Cacopsylla melanoneura TaxID=428564 RepID=A0A8D8LZM8_9HEMI
MRRSVLPDGLHLALDQVQKSSRLKKKKKPPFQSYSHFVVYSRRGYKGAGVQTCALPIYSAKVIFDRPYPVLTPYPVEKIVERPGPFERGVHIDGPVPYPVEPKILL